MTDRISGFTVILDHDIRDDDIAPVLAAIEMVKHVISVEPHVADPIGEVVARTRRDREWRSALLPLYMNGPVADA